MVYNDNFVVVEGKELNKSFNFPFKCYENNDKNKKR